MIDSINPPLLTEAYITTLSPLCCSLNSQFPSSGQAQIAFLPQYLIPPDLRSLSGTWSLLCTFTCDFIKTYFSHRHSRPRLTGGDLDVWHHNSQSPSHTKMALPEVFCCAAAASSHTWKADYGSPILSHQDWLTCLIQSI